MEDSAKNPSIVLPIFVGSSTDRPGWRLEDDPRGLEAPEVAIHQMSVTISLGIIRLEELTVKHPFWAHCGAR